MNEGLNQITIPDFDDDDLNPSHIPFGHTNAFNFGSSSGQESPTASTPIQTPDRTDRLFFHSRGDSVNSEDSGSGSIPFVNSSASSATTANSGFSRKSSFASFRNAFKSIKTSDPPPVPPVVYPALSNPFNRSTSSLAHVPTSGRRPSVTASPPSGRAHTPTFFGQESKHMRGQSSRSKGYSHVKSQHSRTGSTFHYSDNGSDQSHSFGAMSARQGTPPPVPRMPNGLNSRVNTPPNDIDDEAVIEPRTPFEFALHAVFLRFVTAAEVKIETYLKIPLDRDCFLNDIMGQTADTAFDALLNILAQIAVKRAKPVVDSILRWRKTQQESVGGDILRHHSSSALSSTRSARGQDIVSALNERRTLASVYIMTRAFVAVAETVSKDGMTEQTGMMLEDTAFEQFRKSDNRISTPSVNQQAISELNTILLGHLSKLRFISVTDRFLTELQPLASGQVPKDSDMKYETLIKGLRHIQINVWPPEAFEEGAEFLERLSKSFENAHGLRLKIAFAEILVRLLHPIGKTAQAEVNDPAWAKAIETIYPRAFNMLNKPRYWNVAYPLVITSLCVAPHEYFLRNWMTCMEAGFNKLKEKLFRTPVMNGILRLVWTYLYRCHEPISTATTKIDTVLKHLFPPNRSTIYGFDEHLDPYVYLVHFVLSRHFEIGSEFVLTLMQEQAVLVSSSSRPTLTYERANVGLEAALLSAHLIERDVSAPSWPSNSDFFVLPEKNDYPSSSDFFPASFPQKPGFQAFFDRCATVVSAIAKACAKSVGRMSVFDDQWSSSQNHNFGEDATNFVMRQHLDGNVIFPISLLPQISLLQLCFTSWPRSLHRSLPLNEVLEMLFRGLMHVEPALADSASLSLQRIAADPAQMSSIISSFSQHLFTPTSIGGEGSGHKLICENSRVLRSWLSLVKVWADSLVQKDVTSFEESEALSVTALLREVEAAALFLLSFASRSIRIVAIKTIRILEGIVNHLFNQKPSPFFEVSEKAFPILDLLLHRSFPRNHFDQQEDTLEANQRARLARWRSASYPDALLRLAESDDDKDRILWGFMFFSFIRSCVELKVPILRPCREMWSAALARYHSIVTTLSGVNNRLPPSQQQSRSPVTASRERDKSIVDHISVISQWHTWMRVICCTASSDIRSVTKRDQPHGPLDLIYEHERMATTRGLFRYLTPFLGSDHSIFRDTAVISVSSFPPDAYAQLLEDLSVFAARHFYDDVRTKVHQSPSTRRSRHHDRLYLAVTHIYQLTAHNLKEQRGIGKQDTLTNVLKFVRQTQAFLSSTEIRRDWQQQRLRRYFCGIVECLFDGLAALQSSDRFIPPNTHLTLYRLCEGWCQCGTQSEEVMQSLIDMQMAATAGFMESHQKAAAIEKFQTETRLLSHAAVGAMASLCQKAFFPPVVSSSSPADKLHIDQIVPLDAASTLDRIVAMLASLHESVQSGGRKALRSLLSHATADDSFIREVLRRSFVTSRELKTSNCRFFEVVADVLCNVDTHPFKFAHVVILGLSNLCSPLVNIRQHAFDILDMVHINNRGQSADLAIHECMIRTATPSVYLEAQGRISEEIARFHRSEGINVLVQFSDCLPLVQESLSSSVMDYTLRGLTPWLQEINLVTEEKTLSTSGSRILYHLVLLTLRFHERFPGIIQSLWSRIIEHSHAPNPPAIVKFLLEQLGKFGTTVLIDCSKQIISILSQTSASLQLLEDLCSYMEPGGMLPYVESTFGDRNALDQSSNLDFETVLVGQAKHSFGYGQLAFLLFGNVNLYQVWQSDKHIPLLLHMSLMHVDHRSSYFRESARQIFFQIIRSLISSFGDLQESSINQSRISLRKSIIEFEQTQETIFWLEDDTISVTSSKMKRLCEFIMGLLRHLKPSLTNEWGSLALNWGTACSIRGMASRSLQIFRALNCSMRSSDYALLLGRLSNTVADADANVQSFTTEIILTLQSLLVAGNLDETLLPSTFWCACACLLTPIESEFSQTIDFVNALLDRLDIDDPLVVDAVTAQRPFHWTGLFAGLQPLLLIGLRSQLTFDKTMTLLRRLSKIDNPTLVDPSSSRLRDIYTVCLPWCLKEIEKDNMDEALLDLAMSTEQLALRSDLPNITRIMTSFLKRRFRTKDDFLRQAAASLREYYASNHWTEVVALLLSLVLNQERWLRVKAMQILKVLFQLRETRNPVDILGSELLMPLLRLIPTDLATQALEVLEEPLAISGGLSAKHVLRMSIQATPRDTTLSGDVFGVPESSGWSIPRPHDQREICRANMMAVFDTRKVPTRPSLVEFEPEVESLPETVAVDTDDDLGDLVQNLHELSTFFQEEEPHQIPPSLSSHQLEARVAAILAKSDTPVLDSPRTPLADVIYRTDGYPDLVDSDEDSGSDIIADSFAYDSVISLPLNGRHGITPKAYL